jgi:hypothetical protein
MSNRLTFAMCVLLGAAWSIPPTVFAQLGESHPDAEAAYETLLRGPVHEAFAEQYNPDPQPGLVVPQQPPEPVEELPPEIRPEGDNVIWIAGYWAWDDEREDFVWISGIWRQVPPGMRWLSGYWAETAGGWQWVSGTWIDETVDELQYLPEPPQTLEMGPVGEPPSEDHVWIPGTWLHQANRYAWRPGYWSVGHRNQVWIPARYVWTPRGCIYVAGYWDYQLAYRGHLFAPVYFNRPIYRNAGFFYTPSVYVSANLLMNHFWVRPGYCHYYFGDYYGPRYSSWGIYPWFRFPHLHRRAYDPLYSHYRHRHWSSWQDHHHRWSSRHDWYTRHSEWRPPRTWNQQTTVQNNIVNIDARRYNRTDITNINNILLGRSLSDVADRRDEASRMVRIDQQQRERYRQEFDRTRHIAETRRRVESGQRLDLADQRGAAVRGRPGDAGLSGRGSLRLPIPADTLRTTRESAERREGWSQRAEPSPGGRSGRSDVQDRVRSPADPRADRRPESGEPGRPPMRERSGESSPRETLRPSVPLPGAPGVTPPRPRPDAPDRRGPSTDPRRETAPDRSRAAGGTSDRSTPFGTPPAVRPERSPDRSAPWLRQPAPPASRPSPSVSRPAPSAGRPALSASRPAPSASRPAPSASRPAPSVSRPAPSVSRPAPSVSRPAPSVSRPAPSASRPAPSVSRPAPSASRPAPSASRPAPSVSRPAPSVSRPAPSVSRPAPSASRPAPSASRPAPSASRPAPSASRPAPSASRPAPSVSRPAPSVGRPAPSVSRPSPSVRRPSPSVSRPSPSVSRPSPSVRRPSPSVSRPSPSASRPSPSASRPSPSASRPAPSASRPSPSASRPSPSASRPSSSASRSAPSGRGTPALSRGSSGGASPSARSQRGGGERGRRTR